MLQTHTGLTLTRDLRTKAKKQTNWSKSNTKVESLYHILRLPCQNSVPKLFEGATSVLYLQLPSSFSLELTLTERSPSTSHHSHCRGLWTIRANGDSPLPPSTPWSMPSTGYHALTSLVSFTFRGCHFPVLPVHSSSCCLPLSTMGQHSVPALLFSASLTPLAVFSSFMSVVPSIH